MIYIRLMNLNSLDLNLLVALDALLREASVSRAAMRLHLSQPATSHALQRLRDLIGDPLLVRSGARNLIVDPRELIYATIDSGVITLVTSQVEGQSSFRTLEEPQSALDPDLFWRAHRSYVVNVNRIREVVPWFKSTYQLRMDDKKTSEIPVSRLQSRRLREMLNL